ncbi:peptidase S1 [Tsukamurella paurometabola]|uniref:Peptidase S1 n=1 Tax=Tsukamurella paurometabola TaxID=2061 RepID=A0ABS5N7D3_TSUPA|nr:peptidase S1 [Tsukamurella paurometabola]MBS4100189.1 peptidase S1 [Tsukamurella paurometabola]
MTDGTRIGAALRRGTIGVVTMLVSGALLTPAFASGAPTPSAPAPSPAPKPAAPGAPVKPSATPNPGAPSTPAQPSAPSSVPTRTPAPTSVAPGDRIDILQRSLGGGRFESLQCTMGFAVTAPDGERLGVTAGHCGAPQQPVGVKKWIVGEVVQSKAPEVKEDPNRPGHYSPVDPFGPDWATFRLTDPQVKLLASAPGMTPRSVGTARVGDPVCQLGSVNGRRCGKVTKVVGDWVVADIVTTQGDSGGPLIRTSDNAAIGIITDAVTLTDRDSGKVTQQLTQYYSLNAALRAAGGARLATN